jgi:hypothetical protein
MNYEKIYTMLCERGKTRKKVRGSNLERHHIIPTFFFKNPKRVKRYNDGIYEGDGEHIGNITYLTPREHFIAHLLLCKIWKGTKWEYRCYTACKMFLIGGETNDNRDVFRQNSRLIEKYKIQVNLGLSKGKTGTMPAKDAITGERLGIVEMTHPKVISGEWVHITKGIKKSDEILEKYRKNSKGLSNSNSKYSDEELLNSYKECCYYYGKLVNGSLWLPYAKRNNLPYITSWKSFRFDGRGKNGMVEDFLAIAEKEKRSIEIVTNYKSKEWHTFLKKEINKWESK